MWRRYSIGIVVLLFLGQISVSFGHEAESDRLTIVQRAPAHLSLTFFLNETSLLQSLLNPKIDPTSGREGFLLSMSAMRDEDFVRVVNEARLRFAATVILRDQADQVIQLRNWRWTPQDELRRELRELAIQSIISDQSLPHSNSKLNEISGVVTVDAIATTPIASISLSLPPALSDILVVAYRPTQIQYKSSEQKPLKIRF